MISGGRQSQFEMLHVQILALPICQLIIHQLSIRQLVTQVRVKLICDQYEIRISPQSFDTALIIVPSSLS